MDKILKYNGKLLRWNNGIIRAEQVAPTPPTPDIPTDYIAFWKFDGDVTEETGTYTATAYNSPTYSTGQFGQCINFASSAYVTTSLTSSGIFTESNPYTLSFWVKSTQGARLYFMGASNSGGEPFSFGVESPTWLYWQRGSGGATLGHWEDIDDGNWHNITLRYDPTITTSEIWVDGLFDGENTSAAAASTNNYALQFGRLGSYNGLYYNGAMEYLRLYDYALTDTQIEAIADEV